jgi:hypothetical protein
MSDPIEICKLKIELLLKEYDCRLESEDSRNKIYIVDEDNCFELDTN